MNTTEPTPEAKEQAAFAAYVAVKKCIAKLTGDESIITGTVTKLNEQRAKEAGLFDVFVEARDAWWDSQMYVRRGN